MKYRITTEHELSNQVLKNHLESLLQILSENRVEKLLLLFGFAWGNDFNNWREMELMTKDIIPVLNLVENQNYGKLGDDDLILHFRERNFFCEFNFCHHGGIDWGFQDETDQFSLFQSLLNYFKSNFKEINCEREIRPKNKSSNWERFNLKDFKAK